MSNYLAVAIGPPVESRQAAKGVTVSDEGELRLGALSLHRGGRLEPVRVAWRIAGAAGAPVVAALGGISAHRRVCDIADPRRGWWSTLVGSGLPLDTGRFRVLAIDWLGSNSKSALTLEGGIARIDARDQAQALLAVCDHLGIAKLDAFAGASYGGMVGLAFAEQFPQRVGQVLVISAAHRSNALSTAWRAIQREVVRHAERLGDGAGGLRIARALAMTTYRTRAELNARFPVDETGAGRAGFSVEDYLFARGDDFAKLHSPETFLCLSESIDRFRVDPAKIRVPVTLVAIVEDQLVPVEDIRELASRLAGPCRLFELNSKYGHDAFLKERRLLAPAFAAALDGILV